MFEFLVLVWETAFRSPLHFIGSFTLIAMFLAFLFFSTTIFMRHITLSKQGYPPKRCDADGDSRKDYKEGQ